MDRIGAMFNAIEAAEVGRYGLKYGEILAIYERYKNDRVRMIFAAFTYGFVKGQRSKAQGKA